MKIDTDSNKCGGIGECRYCGKVYANISYHESNHCRENPDLIDQFRDLDLELERKILGAMATSNLTKEERFLMAIISVYDQFDLALSHEDNQGSFIVVPNDEYYQKWLMEAKR